MVEMLGSTDVPHEKLTDTITRLYGYIPYRRGFMDRTALKSSLAVLDQNGVLGLFPEGGIWQMGERRIHSGVAWLSERGQAPVLPVYFDGTKGALQAGLALKRPSIKMTVGYLIPAATQANRISHKEFLRNYATKVMDAVDNLCPAGSRTYQNEILNEEFRIVIHLSDSDGSPVQIPPAIEITQGDFLAKFLHYPTILKIFKVNFKMPIEPLQALAAKPTARQINQACRLILNFLEKENPFFLTYRFGQKEGSSMQQGITELEKLTAWAEASGVNVDITPIRQYFDKAKQIEVVQKEQGVFDHWM
jgi:1-acyl-sn-glycerol-3-phosphate acyltransferase